MPYEIECDIKAMGVTAKEKHRSLRDAQRRVKRLKKFDVSSSDLKELYENDVYRIYYISPDGSTRELIE